jgi:hypothetical protein
LRLLYSIDTKYITSLAAAKHLTVSAAVELASLRRSLFLIIVLWLEIRADGLNRGCDCDTASFCLCYGACLIDYYFNAIAVRNSIPL